VIEELAAADAAVGEAVVKIDDALVHSCPPALLTKHNTIRNSGIPCAAHRRNGNCCPDLVSRAMWQEPLNEFVTLLLVLDPFAAMAVFLAVAGKLTPARSARSRWAP
jgi:hypothetical protein